MSRKAWFAVAAILVICVVLAIGIVSFLPPTPGVTYANFSRLEIGMERERVEALLGKPNFNREQFEGMLELLTGPNRSIWQTEANDFVVLGFDVNDCVISLWWNGQLDDRTAMEKLRDRLPLIARRPAPSLFEVK